MTASLVLAASLVALVVSPCRGGFTDAINADHVLTSLPTPRLTSDNTSLEFSQERQGGFVPMATSPFAAALGSLATGGGGGAMGGLRTVMMGGMLYGLSLIPAVVLALGGQGLPLGGMLGGLGLGKRAIPESSSAKMPLLSEPQTRRLLGMLQAAFRQWNVADELCKQLFVCQMYRQVSSNGVTPDLELFKEALLHILEKGGKRRAGRAAEHLLSQYEHYFVAARMGMNQDDCEVNYARCDLSLYPKDDGFKKQPATVTKKQQQPTVTKKPTEANKEPSSSKKTTPL